MDFGHDVMIHKTPMNLSNERPVKQYKNSKQLGIPVVPQKAVAEVPEIGKPIGEVGCGEPLMTERTH